MINPGDDIYVDEKNQLFSKPRKGRKYLGKYSLKSKEPIEEGHQETGLVPSNVAITKEMTVEGKKLRKEGFSLSTNAVKIPELNKVRKTPEFSVGG